MPKAFDSNTQEAEAGGPLGLQGHLGLHRVPSRPSELHSDTLSEVSKIRAQRGTFPNVRNSGVAVAEGAGVSTRKQGASASGPEPSGRI